MPETFLAFLTPCCAGSRGHGTELTRCPRCSGELTTAKQARHRCKVAAAPAPAAPAPAGTPLHHTGTTPLQPRKRKRVTWQDYDGFDEGEDAAGSGEAVAAVAAAAAAAAGGGELSPPPAKQLHTQQTTPRGAAAAALLMSIHQRRSPDSRGSVGGARGVAERAAAPAKVATQDGPLRWWQVAVQPEMHGLAAGAPLPPRPPPLLPVASAPARPSMQPPSTLVPLPLPLPASALAVPAQPPVLLSRLPPPALAPAPPAPPPLLPASTALAGAGPAALQQALQQAQMLPAAGPAMENLLQLMALLKASRWRCTACVALRHACGLRTTVLLRCLLRCLCCCLRSCLPRRCLVVTLTQVPPPDPPA